MEENISPISKHEAQLGKPDGEHRRFGRFVGAVNLLLDIVVYLPSPPASPHILTHFLTVSPNYSVLSSADFSRILFMNV
jgi:hypothetical protein